MKRFSWRLPLQSCTIRSFDFGWADQRSRSHRYCRSTILYSGAGDARGKPFWFPVTFFRRFPCWLTILELLIHGALLEEESLAELEQKSSKHVSGLRSLILHRRQEFWNAISTKPIFPYKTTTICVYTIWSCPWGKLQLLLETDWEQKHIPVKKVLKITSSVWQGAKELLKLNQCEFWIKMEEIYSADYPGFVPVSNPADL